MSSSTASKLDGFAGLEGAKRLVLRLATEDSGVHAVLLYGAAGSGKTTLAEALAEAWLCRSPGAEGADGVCQPCAAFGRGTNPDFLRIRPVGASSIIRQSAIDPATPPDDDYPTPLRPFFRTPPLMSRHKVTLIESAHRMMGPASNALLKTLEEPHPYAKLILTTDSVGGVLPTILSRCLAVACSLPSADEIRRLFPDASDDDLRLAENTPGRTAGILASPEPYRRIAGFARGLLQRQPGEALVASEEFRAICDGIESVTGSGARAANAEGLALLATFLAREPAADPRWAQWAIEAHRRILQNGGAGVVFDALFARMLLR